MNYKLTNINKIVTSDIHDFIATSNANFDKQIQDIANAIAKDCKNRPVVLVCGPSGAGKTTTSIKLDAALEKLGHSSFTIPMDNWYKPLTPQEMALSKLGKLDLETYERIDNDLLSSNLKSMMNYQPIHLPHYDFATSSRYYEKQEFVRPKDSIVIIEGIHALNPDVISGVDNVWRIFINLVDTCSYYSYIFDSQKVRLMRRLVRDYFNRGRTFQETFNMYPSVCNGEEKYIKPHINNIDFHLNSFHPYELGVYAHFINQHKEMLTNEINEYFPYLDKIKFVDPILVSDDCLIHEFIAH